MDVLRDSERTNENVSHFAMAHLLHKQKVVMMSAQKNNRVLNIAL